VGATGTEGEEEEDDDDDDDAIRVISSKSRGGEGHG
jgi:hypothetical protein